MEDVSIKDAKEHLEELLDRAARGEDVRIADPKIGVVRLMPVREAAVDVTAPRVTDTMVPFVPPRIPGKYKGKYQVPARLMEPMSEEELRDWYGDN